MVLRGWCFRRLLVLAVVASFLSCSALAFAQVPRIMNYQGYLTNSGGTPLNGTYSITFRIYDAATGGNLLWYETQSVTVTNGYFDVQLDLSVNGGDTLKFGRPYWITFEVGSDGEMSPREKLAPVSFSFRSVFADTADYSLSGGTLGGSGSQNYVSKWTSGSALGNSQLYDNGSRVGIGTTSPAYRLDVNGSAGFNGNVDFRKNQAINFRLENRTSDPASPAVGQMWIRTDL